MAHIEKNIQFYAFCKVRIDLPVREGSKLESREAAQYFSYSSGHRQLNGYAKHQWLQYTDSREHKDFTCVKVK